MNKAILLDAVNRTITEIEISSWKDISPAIGCDLFTVVEMDEENDLYVDDEGLLKNPDYFIKLEGYAQPLAGNGLILGSNRNTGDSCDTSLTVDEVKAKIQFIDIVDVIFGRY